MGLVRNIDSPFRFDDRNDDLHQPPPLLGQHTTEVLTGLLGMDPDDVDDLARRSVVCIPTRRRPMDEQVAVRAMAGSESYE